MMVELISEEKIGSPDYLRIRTEFQDLWNRLFLAKNDLDEVVFRHFGPCWPLVKCLLLTKFRYAWYRFKPTRHILTSEMILRSNQLWMPRLWEYPWAILNSNIKPESKVLDVGSGWALFPLYLALKCNHVDSVDINKAQMKILSPRLASILGVIVNYKVGDALSLPVDDNTYDCVYCISVLEHLEERIEGGKYVNRHEQRLDRKAIREFLRVVKPGGRVILTLDYATKTISLRSFDFDYVKDLLTEFRSNLLKPLEALGQIQITPQKESELRRLWLEFFPYDPNYPAGGALGIVLTK